MYKFFAITGRGLENLCADEIIASTGAKITSITYRRVSATLSESPALLLKLKTIEDVFLNLGTWSGIDHRRSAISQLTLLSAQLEIDKGIQTISQFRSIRSKPTFSVTANFVGKRNYSTDEIKLAVAAGIKQVNGAWNYSLEDHQSDLNIRIFIEHDQAFIGLRIGANPLNKRNYKGAHISGSLNPPVAAAMVYLLGSPRGLMVADPFCGAGTILIEASSQGYIPIGGDINFLAIASAQLNTFSAGLNIPYCYWNALHLPLKPHSIGGIITNLPWGKQTTVELPPPHFYSEICSELERILVDNGRIVILSTAPDLVHFTRLKILKQFEISVSGQRPALMLFG